MTEYKDYRYSQCFIVGNRVPTQKLNELKGYEKKFHPFFGSVYCYIGDRQ